MIGQWFQSRMNLVMSSVSRGIGGIIQCQVPCKNVMVHEKFDLPKFARCKYGAKKSKRGGKQRQRWQILHLHTSLHGVVNLYANAVFTIFVLDLTSVYTFLHLICTK